MLRCVMAWQNYRVGDTITPISRMDEQRLLAMRFYGRRFWELVSETPQPAAAASPEPLPPIRPEPPKRRRTQEQKP